MIIFRFHMEALNIYTKTTDIEHLNLSAHCHEAHHQLIYMIKGTLHIKVDDTQYFLPERFIGLIPANKMHQLQSRNEMVKMFLVYFPKTIELTSFVQLSANNFVIGNLRYLSKLPNQITKTNHVQHYQFAFAFLDLLKHMESLQAFPLKGLMSPQNERLKNVLCYIEQNYTEKISLDTVAEKFGFSVRNLTRLFKKENSSFNNHINYLRIVHAIEKFTDTDDSIEKIAFEVGYGTASNFSRSFKKYTGLSPREFIKANTTNTFITTEETYTF